MAWKVIVVEDSPTAREALVAAFHSRPEFRVIAACAGGDQALRLARRMRPDLMSMDVMLPDTDGIAVTRQILSEIRTRVVVVSSNTPTRASPLSLDALKAGAMEIVSKPSVHDTHALNGLLDIATALCNHPAPGAQHVQSAVDAQPLRARVTTSSKLPDMKLKLKPVRPRLIAVGASTGGPAALELLLRRLPEDFHLPIVIAQHMLAGYSEGLAAWLDSASALKVKIAEAGEVIHSGRVYIAPDFNHITVTRQGTVALHPVVGEQAGHVPCVDRLFESVNDAYGMSAIAVILTGMGDDGAAALKRLKKTGAVTIAQDQKSSFIYGMPHAALQLEPGHLVLSLDHIAYYLAAQSVV